MSLKKIEGGPTGVSTVELSLYRNDNKKLTSADLAEENKDDRSPSFISSYMRRSDSFTRRFRNASTAEEMKELARRVVGERKGQWWILMPNSTIKIYWESIVLFLLMYTLVVLPLRVGFSESMILEHASINAIDLVVDCLFAIDIIITSISAYESKQNLITNQRKICFHYLCSLWFPLDVLAAIPFHEIFTKLGTGEDNPLIPFKGGVKAAKFLKFMRLIRVLKLMRLHRVWPVFAKLEDSPSLKRNQVRAGKICFVLVSAFHFFACIWVFLGDLQTTYYIDITPTEVEMWSSDEKSTLWSEGFWLDSYYFWKFNNGLRPNAGFVKLDSIVIEIGYYLCPNDSDTNSSVSIYIEDWDENDDVVLLELGSPNKDPMNTSDIMARNYSNLSATILCDRITIVPSFIDENDTVCGVWNTDNFNNSDLCAKLELHTKEIHDTSLGDLGWMENINDEDALGLRRELFLAVDNKTIFIDYISPANMTWSDTRGESNTWFVEEGLDPTKVGVTYLTSFYWSVTTLSTVGYGDISPTNLLETVYVTFVMVVGAWIFSYVTASVTSFSVQKDKEQKEYRKKMRNLHAYLQDTDKEPQAQLPPQLKEQLLNRMQIIWRRRVRMNKGKDMVLSFWQDLPESLRWKVARRRVKPLIDKCEFLYTFEKFVELPDKRDQCLLKVWRSVHKRESLAGTEFPSGLKVPKEGSWFFPRSQADFLTPMDDSTDVLRVINKDPSVYHAPIILDKDEDQILGAVAASKDLNDKILPSFFKVPTSYGSWVVGENDDGKLILKNSLWTQRDENFLGFIAEHLQPMYFLKDEVVCSPGDKCDKLYIIYSGYFSLYVRYPDDSPQDDCGEDDLLSILQRRQTDVSRPSSGWRPSFFGLSRQGSKLKLSQNTSSPKLARSPRGKNDKMFVLERGDLFGHVALFKTHCFKGTILATTTECVVRYITVENLRNILWNRHAGGPETETESKSYQQREAKRYFENRVDVDYRRWFKGAFDGATALNSEKWSYEDAVRGIGKSVKRLHNSLLGKEEKNRLKEFFTKASEEWANKKKDIKKSAERLKKGKKLLRYVDLFLSRGVTVSKVISLTTKNSVNALNILPPILVGCLWEYLKVRKSQGPANWTPADLAQHIRSWGDELAPYAEFFELDGIDGQRFLGLDRKGIRKIEILPKSLEETLLNHITNLRRIQTDKRKSEIEKEPPKADFQRSHTYHQSTTKPVDKRLKVMNEPSQSSRVYSSFVNRQAQEAKTLPTPGIIPLEEPKTTNWHVDLDATDSVVDDLHATQSFYSDNGTKDIIDRN